MKEAYTYKIEQLDIQYGHVLVKYIPTNQSLTALSYSVPIEIDESGAVIPLETLVDKFAPQREWAAQKFLKENADSLLANS